MTDDPYFDEKKELIKLDSDRADLIKKVKSEWYQDIVLPHVMTIQSHSCPIYRRKQNGTGRQWTCSYAVEKDLQISHCLNSLSEFKPHQCEGWRCDQCDFDICLECV